MIEEIAETLNSLENAEIQPVTSVASTLTPSSEQVETTEEQKMDEEDKPVKFGKICDPQALGCCEFCGGPVKRRRFCSPVKKFCSKGCARSARKAKVGKNCNRPIMFKLNAKSRYVATNLAYKELRISPLTKYVAHNKPLNVK